MTRMGNSRAWLALGLVSTLALLVGAISFPVPANVNGPSSGYTGAPGESNCHGCHGSFTLNSGPAAFGITLGSQQFTPSATAPVTVAFTGSPSVRHGFQITARNSANVAVGSWVITQTGLTKNASGSTFHHEHTSAGSLQNAWSMNWIAPATLPAGPVTFYASGAQCNNTGGTSGDYTYTATKKLYQAALTTTATTWPVGTTKTVSLAAPGHGGQLYMIAVSESTTPVNFGGAFTLEVDPFTGLTDLALNTPALFSNFLGVLNSAGQATATVNVPPIPSLAGFALHFAAITATTAYVPTEVSNRVDVVLQ